MAFKNSRRIVASSAAPLFAFALGGTFLGLSAETASAQTVTRNGITYRAAMFGGASAYTPFGATRGISAVPYGVTVYNSNPYGYNSTRATVYGANLYGQYPYRSNPYSSNPYAPNPYAANPYAAYGPNPNAAYAGYGSGAASAFGLQSSPQSRMQGQTQTNQTPPQASGSISARRVTPTELFVQWSGDPNGVRQVTLALFDAEGAMLDSRIFMEPSVQTTFALTPDAAYYGAQVQYDNGPSRNIYAPIR